MQNLYRSLFIDLSHKYLHRIAKSEASLFINCALLCVSNVRAYVRVVRLRLLIETVLQKLFAVKLNLMSANLGVVFMRRPNRPHREPNEYDYQNYIWKDLAQRILKKDEHIAGDTTVDELAVRLESEFDKQISTSTLGQATFT